MMKSCHNNRRVQQTEDSREEPAKGGQQAASDHFGDSVADSPADGTHNRMSEYYCRQQRADRNHNHTDYFRTVLFKEFFQEHQNKSGHHGGDYLSLVADHLHLEKSEIPHRDLCGCSYAEAVQQLGRHQGQAQNNSQNLGGSHLFGNGPADTHRQHMEDRLSDEPEETVHAGPELGNIRQGQSSVFKKADLADHVPEAQNQTAADQSRNQRGENLSQGSHNFLQGLLIGFCRGFHRFLADSLDARVSRKLIVKHTYISDGVMFEFTQSRHRPDYFRFYDNAVRRPRGSLPQPDTKPEGAEYTK